MINEIILAQFKKHIFFKEKINSKIVLITGENAVGKTSILEAISLFAPGSGIFTLNLDNIVSFEKTSFEIKIKNNFNASILYANDKKEIKINETKQKPLNLLEYMRIYGLNPYIALAFWKDSSLRRKYFDKLILQNDITYATFYTKYLKAIKERNKLIEENKLITKFDQILQSIIIENGLKVTKIRKKVLEKIINTTPQIIKDFIGSDLIINMHPNLEEQEKIFEKPLAENFIGPHKTKFELNTIGYKGNYASTGQQKKLLIALTILALPDNDTENLLLLDDLFTTLDSETINNLIKILKTCNFQTWITSIQKIQDKDIQIIELT